MVTRVNASANHDIHPGDTITHVNGKAALHESAISGLTGRITLTLVPAAIHGAPSASIIAMFNTLKQSFTVEQRLFQVFYRVNADYNSDTDDSRICRWLSIDVKKGDVVQIMSQDDNWLQVWELSMFHSFDSSVFL